MKEQPKCQELHDSWKLKRGSLSFCIFDDPVQRQNKILQDYWISPSIQYLPAQNVPAAKNNKQTIKPYPK